MTDRYTPTWRELDALEVVQHAGEDGLSRESAARAGISWQALESCCRRGFVRLDDGVWTLTPAGADACHVYGGRTTS